MQFKTFICSKCYYNQLSRLSCKHVVCNNEFHFQIELMSLWISEQIGRNGMDWIDLAKDGNQWKALANKVVNLWVA
jgi:hypothetical protein